MNINKTNSNFNPVNTKFREVDPKKLNRDVREVQPEIPGDNFTSVNETSQPPQVRTRLFKSSGADKKTGDTPIPAQWTVLTYLNGNGDLQSDVEGNMKTLERVGSDDKIKFVAQIARGDEDGKAQRVLLNKPSWMGMKKNSKIMADLGPTNMSHPQSLKDFVTWGMKKFPAEHYALILNGHGMGFVGSMPDENADDLMLTPEFESAMNAIAKETGKKIDVLGFDSCLMANAETAYAAKNAANFMVASEEVLQVGNWDYGEFGGKMKAEANGDGLTVGEALESIVRSQNNYRLLTASIINLTKMPEFADKLKSFTDKLLSTKESDYRIRSNFLKAQHYCQAHILENASNGGSVNTKPMDQMRDVASVALEICRDEKIQDNDLKKAALALAKFTVDKVVLFEMHRKDYGLGDSAGMSIYAPRSEADKYSDFYQDKMSLSKETGWGKVVEKFGTSH